MKSVTPNSLFETLKNVKIGGKICQFTPEKCEEIAPLINQINQLKKERNALILTHSYVSPEIILGVADYVGDSYELSKKALQSNADIIVFVAVKFMAETAKLLNPKKRVFIPSELNGCSLADSITQQDVQRLKKQYPDYTFMCYINTSVDVKAECDVCVTSSNVYSITEKIKNPNIYFLPDKLMAKNLIEYTTIHCPEKNIKYWDGTCYVHEEYDSDMIDFLKTKHPDLLVLSHPECSPEVTKASDFVGSTSQMINHVKTTSSNAYFMLTECGLTNRIQLELPKKNFVGSCTMCRYMKANSLESILNTLTTLPTHQEVEVPLSIQKKAVACIDKMFELTD